ncbi:thioredoxin [Penicillium argentinense]|uniref:Thioredoxin n=1 Tax=Penicillium argentinense TaxID=1131581 RepID=A0A9W9EYT5_9EURO|nr:thioredoxin [Penicillium argentinense]KAJ5090356.1 thioredoxin [Penicillium argentinense]
MYNQKFGSERVSQMFTRLSAVGKAEGINFSFGGNTGKTRDSHRVIWFAGEQEKSFPSSVGEVGGIQTRVVENLFRAYFEEEKNITHRDVLVDAAVKAGLERSSVDALLDTDEGGEEVDGEAGNAARKLVSGVPFFEIGRYVVEGADEPETFLEIFGKVRDGQ